MHRAGRSRGAGVRATGLRTHRQGPRQADQRRLLRDSGGARALRGRRRHGRPQRRRGRRAPRGRRGRRLRAGQPAERRPDLPGTTGQTRRLAVRLRSRRCRRTATCCAPPSTSPTSRSARRRSPRTTTPGWGRRSSPRACADGRLSVAHVGDSRLYLLAGGALRQVTQDDSWMASMLAHDPNADPLLLRASPHAQRADQRRRRHGRGPRSTSWSSRSPAASCCCCRPTASTACWTTRRIEQHDAGG